jgi:hypothetical protein
VERRWLEVRLVSAMFVVIDGLNRRVGVVHVMRFVGGKEARC